MKNNRLTELLNSGKRNLLNIYFTAGYPKIDDLQKIIPACSENGVDLMEIGIPFSDPLADGATIQQSSQIAIKNGMNLNLLFSQLEAIKSQNKTPLLLMGYFNSILHYGIEEFCKKCYENEISGLIIPDLPLNEFLSDCKGLFEKYNLHNIFLISPHTSDERIREIDKHSTAFIYAVSSSSTTGSKQNIDEAENFLKRISEMDLTHAVLTGFNINNRDSFLKACKYTRGGIIGSAYIKAIAEPSSIEKNTKSFVQSILTP